MDRQRWNARYEAAPALFAVHPLVSSALTAGLPPGPVLELACGRSGSALALAEAGRTVLAVDVSDVAVAQLAAEVRRRGLAALVRCVVADAASFTTSLSPAAARFAMVLCTRFWQADVFDNAAAAVTPGGLLAWESLCESNDSRGPFRIRHGELGARLPGGFRVLEERVVADAANRFTRLLARRRSMPS